jgi:hypothetical protein
MCLLTGAREQWVRFALRGSSYESMMMYSICENPEGPCCSCMINGTVRPTKRWRIKHDQCGSVALCRLVFQVQECRRPRRRPSPTPFQVPSSLQPVQSPARPVSSLFSLSSLHVRRRRQLFPKCSSGSIPGTIALPEVPDPGLPGLIAHCDEVKVGLCRPQGCGWG